VPAAARPLGRAFTPDLSEAQSDVIHGNKNNLNKTAFIQIHSFERIVTSRHAHWTYLQNACYIFCPSF
jgi:hypothetical protein